MTRLHPSRSAPALAAAACWSALSVSAPPADVPPPPPAPAPTFDHALFDAILAEHVDAEGRVDYAALQRDTRRLDRYVATLADAPLDELSRDETLALLINAYNAFTLRLILDYYPLESIKDIPDDRRWKHKRWNVGGNIWSLNDLEHEQIRPRFGEPRIHFALVCAAAGCPPLRGEAYTAERLEAQLEDQARRVHRGDRWLVYDAAAGVVHLTKLYDWYAGDFTQETPSVLAYAARYEPRLREALEAGRPPEVRWLDYDWSLNATRDAR